MGLDEDSVGDVVGLDGGVFDGEIAEEGGDMGEEGAVVVEGGEEGVEGEGGGGGDEG